MKTKTLEQYVTTDDAYLTQAQFGLMEEKLKLIETTMRDTKFSVKQMDNKVKVVFREVSPRFD